MDRWDTEEQLRGRQNDEFKALKECFADQLVDLRKLVKVSRNPKKRKRDRLWIPIELSVKIESRPEPIAEFDLHIRCTRKYPLVPPAIGFKNVKGIGRSLIVKLHKQLKHEAANEDLKGQGCIALLIMRAQQFLEDHYRDLELNNKSFYDQMLEQKQCCDRKAELNRKQRDELDKIERDRQVEEIRQKILRKRELFNESKKRRDSQNSTFENEVDDATYDFEGDLDADSTTASLTDDGDTTNKIEELDEMNDDETTLMRSKRSTIFGSREARSSLEDQAAEKARYQSRVDLEYEVIEELGHGGFGTVYKVRNRVDSRLYALKKVKLNPDNETLNEKIMREVKLLSRLNHENVIRYYTAWNEIEIRESHSSIVDSSAGDDTAMSSKIDQESCILSQRSLSSSDEDEADDVYHTSYLINDKNVERYNSGETTANYVVFETSANRDESEIVESMKKALGPLSDVDSSDDENQSITKTNHVRVKTNRWLYIQMELGQGTLREAIDQGLPKQKDRARRFFREILDGLCHIHRQGIIHRDLKPVNIFLDSMDRPKIGDFGLATTNLFIVTQSSGVAGSSTATAIKPNRMSLEKLRLLASPEQNDSPEICNKSGERLRYVHSNQTDNIGTPLYMSPELSATSEKARIAKVIYSHKVDIYSLGIIYFEMLYPFKTGHERIATLQDLRKRTINMPQDAEVHLTKEDIELIRLLLTHDLSQRPTSEKLLSSSLLPSVGLKEREYQNVIKQVVQNRQARTHKHMLRLLFEQNDSYVDDFVFDFEDIYGSTASASTKNDTQGLLKDFNTITFVLDQVRMRLEILLRSKGFVNYVTPILMPKYSAQKYYNKHQIEDVVMLMDKNSLILSLPYDLRLPFARTISRNNISYMNRFAIERIYRQRQVLGYHPDQLWECCIDMVTPLQHSSNHSQPADAEIMNLLGDIVKLLPALSSHKPIVKINHIQLVKTIMRMLNIPEEQTDDLVSFISESMSISLKKSNQTQNVSQTNNLILYAGNALPTTVKENLKKDLLASKLITHVTTINGLINCLDVVGETPSEVLKQLEQLSALRNVDCFKNLSQILKGLDETICYAQALGLDLPLKISPGFVLSALKPVEYYSGILLSLECRRYSKTRARAQSSKVVTIAVGGRYDKLMESFSKNRSEVFDRIYSSESEKVVKENRPKAAVGVSLEVEKLSRFMIEDFVDKLNQQDSSTTPTPTQLLNLTSSQLQPQINHAPPLRHWPLDLAICSLTCPKSKSYLAVVVGFIKQLRERGFKCTEISSNEHRSFTLENLSLYCSENKVPYLVTIKAQLVDVASKDDYLQENTNQNQLPKQPSPSSSPSSKDYKQSTTEPPVSPTAIHTNRGCLVVLYQLDKGRLKELKRSDIPTMADYLMKK